MFRARVIIEFKVSHGRSLGLSLSKKKGKERKENDEKMVDLELKKRMV